MHYRVPVFRRLAREPDLAVKVFYGHDVQWHSAQQRQTHRRVRPPEAAYGDKPRSLGRAARCIGSVSRSLVGSSSLPARCRRRVGQIINNLFIYIYSWLRVPVVWWTLGRIAGRSYPRWFSPYRALVKRMERSAVALLGYSSVALRYFQESGYGRSKAFVATNTVDTDAILTTRRFAIERSRTVRTNHGLGSANRALRRISLPGEGGGSSNSGVWDDR